MSSWLLPVIQFIWHFPLSSSHFAAAYLASPDVPLCAYTLHREFCHRFLTYSLFPRLRRKIVTDFPIICMQSQTADHASVDHAHGTECLRNRILQQWRYTTR